MIMEMERSTVKSATRNQIIQVDIKPVDVLFKTSVVPKCFWIGLAKQKIHNNHPPY